MSIYGGADAERSLELSAEKLSVERRSCQYGPNTMSYPSQEPGPPSDLWYSPCPQTLPPTLPSLTSEPHYMLPGEQSPPGHYNTASYGAHHKTVNHNPGSAMFPQYIKQEPGIISDHGLHPNTSILPPFIKQEPGLHVNNTHPRNRLGLVNCNDSPHVQHAHLVLPNESQHHPAFHQHSHPHQDASLYTGLSLPHTIMHGSGLYVHNMPYIKQELGPSMNRIPVQVREDPGDQIEGAIGPLQIKQEPGLLRDVNEGAIGPLQIKQEPGLLRDVNEGDIGPLHIKREPGLLVDGSAGAIGPLRIKREPGLLVDGSAEAIGPLRIKREPGLLVDGSAAAIGPLHIKREPGLLIDIKQESGTSNSVPLPSLTDHSLTPFPSRPINFNFMADIEDIVQPTSSGPLNFLPAEISIDSIKHELAAYEGASYECYSVASKSRAGKVGPIKKEEEDIWEPPLWRQQYDNIRSMRSKRDAPVDKFGCFMNAERDVTPEVRRYQVLVSLMLSSQTKDEVVSKAMTKLKENGLTISSVLETPQEEVARMIFPVGFWNKKAEYIKKTTKILRDKFNNDIPSTVENLVSLAGVGPKMAHLIMDFAWGEVSGIAVDTHVYRITHRIGWMPREVRSPEEARKILERWFPRSEWSDLNLLFVGFGQQICTPVGPKCSRCINKDLCPSSSCGVSTGLPLGLGIEVSSKSKGKRDSKSSTAKSKKVKVQS